MRLSEAALDALEAGAKGGNVDLSWLVETLKEITATLKNQTGLLLIQGALPGEAKYVPPAPAADAPREPETLDEVLEDAQLLRLHEPSRESKKKPKRRPKAG